MGLLMERLVVAVATAAGLTGPTIAQAQAGTSYELFGCSLGKKSVSIRATGSTLTYRFGTPGKAEMSITGSAAQRNVFHRSDRYAGLELQIRFVNGRYSYIVYSMEGNVSTGAKPVAGLVVMKDKKWVADMPCVRYAGFTGAFDINGLPEDDAAYSAM